MSTLPASAGVAGASRLAPGLALTAAIAAAAMALHAWPPLHLLSPLIIAAVVGAMLRNLGFAPEACAPGQAFALRRLLRAAVVLLGFQISVGQALTLGPVGLLVVGFAVAATCLVTLALGRWMGLDRRFVCLIAAGTSICGASAIVAANTVADAPEEDVTYAISCVTLLGTISIFVYPALAALLHLTPRQYGLWAGASIHEVAQVVAAAYQQGDAAGVLGTVAKLSRVALLAPMVFVFARAAPRGTARVAPPLFLLAFLGAIAANSLLKLDPTLLHRLSDVSSGLMAAALAAMGLATDLRALAGRGVRPLLLAVAAWLFIASSVLVLASRYA
jgi:uncharacterized integral membrane protein (TIGR00698 family)